MPQAAGDQSAPAGLPPHRPKAARRTGDPADRRNGTKISGGAASAAATKTHLDLVENEQELFDALVAHVRGMLAPYEYPKEIEFIDELPMTTTGKVQRRVLRLREEERKKPLPGKDSAP